MDTIVFDKEIAVCCVAASSFPDGVLTAFQTLHGKLDRKEERQHFGISHGLPDGGIHYLAAATELNPGEAETLGLDRFTIQKGTYLGLTIPDYLKDLGEIGRTFTRLLQNPDLDPEGYCLEIYAGKDVQCLVKLKNEDQNG
jgi:predicted transcriptional regulator YdeE